MYRYVLRITLGFYSRYKGVHLKKLRKRLGSTFILGGTLKVGILEKLNSLAM